MTEQIRQKLSAKKRDMVVVSSVEDQLTLATGILTPDKREILFTFFMGSDYISIKVALDFDGMIYEHAQIFLIKIYNYLKLATNLSTLSTKSFDTLTIREKREMERSPRTVIILGTDRTMKLSSRNMFKLEPIGTYPETDIDFTFQAVEENTYLQAKRKKEIIVDFTINKETPETFILETSWQYRFAKRVLNYIINAEEIMERLPDNKIPDLLPSDILAG
jgi:hypothetical protein